MFTTAAGLTAGVLADAAFADPRRRHPVAAFGNAAASLEHTWWADTRRRGTLHTAVAVGAPVVVASLLEAAFRRPGRSTADSPEIRSRSHAPFRPTGRTLGRAVALAATTWAVLGGRSLTREAQLLGSSLAQNDITSARERLPHLCGRDPASLDTDGLARATVESVAENTSDAVVAPLFWGALAGLPGLVGYRAINTLDAMVGHKSERYQNFGWASARLDDLANIAPARLSGLLAAAGAPLVGGRPADALHAWRNDAHQHPSPNAGVVEAAFAGALGRRLGGRTVYPYGVDERPVLGSGPPVTPADISRAVRLSRAVSVGALATVVAGRLIVTAAFRRQLRVDHGRMSRIRAHKGTFAHDQRTGGRSSR